PRPPLSTLFPYTTLFRSVLRAHLRRGLGTGAVGNPGVERLGRVLPRLLRLLPVGAVEHPRVPAARTGGARRCLGHHAAAGAGGRSEEHTSELQSREILVC